MKLIKFILIVSLLSHVFQAFSQRVMLIQTDVDKQYETPKKGANRQQYFWVQFSLFGTNLTFDELDNKQDFCTYYGLSFNKKYKVNSIISHGYGYGIHRDSYALSNNGLITANRSGLGKGKLIFVGLNVNYFCRFNFDPKRGNTLGTYLDFAPIGQFNFYQRARFKQCTKKKSENILVERHVLGLETRIGRGALSIYGRYKFRSYKHTYKTKAGIFEDLDLTKWSVGININVSSN